MEPNLPSAQTHKLFRKRLIVIFSLLILSSLLAELYEFAEIWSHSYLNVLFINGILLVLLFAWGFCHGSPYRCKFLVIPSRRGDWLEWVPSLIVFSILAVIFVSSILDPERTSMDYPYSLLLVAGVVPIFEELLFRVCIGEEVRRRVVGWWGLYLSALFFSYIHSMPTFDRLMNFHVGLFIGPFLLGLINEVVFSLRKNILPCIVLHSLANMSGFVLAQIDARWLTLLSDFYL